MLAFLLPPKPDQILSWMFQLLASTRVILDDFLPTEMLLSLRIWIAFIRLIDMKCEHPCFTRTTTSHIAPFTLSYWTTITHIASKTDTGTRMSNLTISDVTKCLPDAIRRKFEASPLSAKTISVCNTYAAWFSSSRTPFFKYYTDHSADHSYEVFRTAIELCDPRSLDHISTEDICLLLASCYCHDCGMHLTEKQFSSLIHPSHTKLYTTLDNVTWPDKWNEFLQEAKRFSRETLVNIFGDDKPISTPPTDPIDFSDRHRLLVGEFLRRQHPSIAHDVSVGMANVIGLPTLASELDPVYNDMVGLVARSHGQSVRSLFGYINNNFNLREFQGAHVVFLMVLLRLSDYAQIQPSRAPTIFTKIHTVKSPVSSMEWRVHESVVNITNSHDDPESIEIESRPKSLVDFLRVKDWLHGLQTEIDTSWAVLGEIYGRQTTNGLSELGMRVRRVRSGIIDGGVDYRFVPEHIRFRVAESEMLSLLLAPLYGDHPLYGIRELVQNAHDAVVESLAISRPDSIASRGRIQIRLDSRSEPPTVIVEDNGLGMSLDVIKNYFLTAGASYRNSADWKRRNIDDMGNSTVDRSGRFGVGALAAFLIGDRIRVRTRNWIDNTGSGYTFTCSLHDREIEIATEPMDVGTTIEIFSDKNRMELLHLAEKSLSRLFCFRDEIELIIETTDPSGEKRTVRQQDRRQFKKNSRSFQTKSLPRVEWCVSNSSWRAPTYVNGILIGNLEKDAAPGPEQALTHDAPLFSCPSFARSDQMATPYFDYDNKIEFHVSDPNAKLAINLARTSFSQTDSEVSEAMRSILFSRFEESVEKLHNTFLSTGRPYAKPEGALEIPWNVFIYRNNNLMPLDGTLLTSANIRSVWNMGADFRDVGNLCQKLPDKHFIFRGRRSKSPTPLITQLRARRTGGELTHFSGCLLCMDTRVADLTLNSGVSPRWAKSMIEAGETVDTTSGRHIVLQFGTVHTEIRDQYKSLLREYACSDLEFYQTRSIFPSSPYQRYSFHTDEELTNAPGLFTNYWRVRYGEYR